MGLRSWISSWRICKKNKQRLRKTAGDGAVSAVRPVEDDCKGSRPIRMRTLGKKIATQIKRRCSMQRLFIVLYKCRIYFSASTSASHSAALASLGMRQSPRGESATDPTLGPSGRQERLNC